MKKSLQLLLVRDPREAFLRKIRWDIHNTPPSCLEVFDLLILSAVMFISRWFFGLARWMVLKGMTRWRKNRSSNDYCLSCASYLRFPACTKYLPLEMMFMSFAFRLTQSVSRHVTSYHIFLFSCADLPWSYRYYDMIPDCPRYH